MARTIPERESLTVEFKSDRGPLRDADLVAAVVCLANSDGGEIYVGVEDDGSITGLSSQHRDINGMKAQIANRTIPSVAVRAEIVEVDGSRDKVLEVARIEVSRSEAIVATADGLVQRRRIQADGKPICVPFHPHEFTQRQSDLRRLDYSALPVAGASDDDLDPLERQRLRTLIGRYGGDPTLLALGDEELDGALGLVAREGGQRTPTVAGLLTIGKEASLRAYLPTHEVAVQDVAETRVRLNEFTRRPLLYVFERVYEQHFAARMVEEEVQVGMFRVPVPNYDRRAFREAVVNALVHRDYTRLGAVHIRWETGGLVISNPGGFVEGVRLDRLLVTEPRPRNPLLADILKRSGLAERTGRGVDLIYEGLLRYGRPAPDYSRSDAQNVVLRLPDAAADLPFLELILAEEERRGGAMPIDALIVLAHLRVAGRLDLSALAREIQKDETAARTVIARLTESGLVQAHGSSRSREYSLSAAVYRRLGKGTEYVRQAAFDDIQQEQMVLQYVDRHARITRKDAADLCRISLDQASRLLRRLSSGGSLVPNRAGRSTYYRRP